MKSKRKSETIKSPIFKTNYNGIKMDTDFEKVDPISLTVPNETYSLRDIVEKFSKEYPKHLLRTGYFDEINDEKPDFDDIDPTRSPDFDLVDAIELKATIHGRKKNTIVENDSEIDDKKQEKLKTKTEKTEKTEIKKQTQTTNTEAVTPDSV